ncbi:class I SAM-dependent methyltransferase [Leptospira borgpetersenii]|uniref:Methyltransferase n=2 Tax=Leptospira borgpetersenii serovar Hardjo-bovis TaxID=338217 RepID=Q04UZ3_LEPBJ|nr:class I SAM-dependent methyltransferase [Leptospira borgpetersenii]ABJ75277.1 Methyltransferase [Leptospira borgpetersenii serovar Hardjo-bovis str. JB197]ABJ79860.1 Methyltransferase [Leptospira borgpetersenii serovar Hardjo-bovis str. L550]AMX59263.1 SAM-dependent methyltransferase [Leptospira borgpetersenii serovar Hardjo]AMX62492.1 SAM-dependent methyltransferase [Leptospira borgpetersenii serovar Hardjo]AMX65734.1 SAM-dependent methyltransferase [Leptospira borgpetersenii serovar Hardj
MRLFRKIKSEEAPDTLAHLYLNPENSSWGNFGYWKNTADYPTACKTLARLLGERADLKRGLKVLDLGFGCGDQFFVWREEFSVNFTDLIGVNGSSVQVRFAKNLLESRSDTSPELICSPVETAIVSFLYQSFDRILCLDSASFFSDRKEFCRQVFRVLKPGGRFVSAELVLKNSRLGILDSWLRDLVCTLSSIPKNNRVTPDSLSRLLRSSGFISDGFDFLEADVFGGFSSFLKKKTKEPYIPQRIARKYSRFAEFLGGERMKRYFQFVLYAAVKPG